MRWCIGDAPHHRFEDVDLRCSSVLVTVKDKVELVSVCQFTASGKCVRSLERRLARGRRVSVATME